MPKVYISPAAHEYNNPCILGDGENDHCGKYAKLLYDELLRCGFDVRIGLLDCVGSDEVQRRVRESNNWGADLHYVCHSNAWNGQLRGNRVYTYPSEKSQNCGAVMVKWHDKIVPAGSRLYTNNEWYEVLTTNAICIYDEISFHDNLEDATWIHEHSQELAENTAQAICEIFGEVYVPKTIPGDVNGDKKVNVADVRVALRSTVGKEKLNAEQTKSGDMNGDGKVSIADIRKLLRKLVGKE